MKKKTIVKIALDVAMLAVLVVLFSKNVISMAFHEIGGLAIIGVFVVHKLLNADWIARVTKNFFKKTTRGRTRFMYVLDCLLVVAFLTIGVSGVFISHVVFAQPQDRQRLEMAAEGEVSQTAEDNAADALPGEMPQKMGGQSVWKVLHYFASALVIILLGIHLGMHFRYMTGILGKLVPFRPAVRRVLSIAAVVVLLGYGCLNLATGSFGRWLAMPFTAMSGEGAPRERRGAAQEGAGEDFTEEARAARREERGRETSFSLLNLLNVIATYFSMTFVFAAATVLLERLTKRRPRAATD